MKTSLNDEAEIARFRAYLKAVGEWNKENLPPPPDASAFEAMTFRRAKLHAHAEIYKRIYPELP